jgi:RNA polymerase sporulation-specific sigma factor
MKHSVLEVFHVFMGLSCFFFVSYVTNSNSFPHPLNAAEEKYYLDEYARGSEEARNILIEHNLRLVAHVVKKYGNHIKETDDFISIGTIGLIKAISTYKPDKGTRLATYAARCIDNEILMHIRASKKFINDVYLQDPVGIDNEGHEVRVEDKLADETDAIDEQVDLKMGVKKLCAAMKKVLHDREKNVIILRYGLTSGDEMTQREIADMLGISRSYVSRIEKKALMKLGREMGV